MIKLIIHIVFTILIVLSTSGLTISLHYCQDQLYDLAFFSTADHCCDTDRNADPCHHDSILSNYSHCKDKVVSVEPTDNYIVTSGFGHYEGSHEAGSLFMLTHLHSFQSLKQPIAGTLTIHKPLESSGVVLSEIQSFLI